ATGKVAETLLGSTKQAICVKFSPNGALLSCGYKDGVVKVFDVSTKTLKYNIGQHEKAVMGISYSPDGKYLISGSRDNSIFIFDLFEGKAIKQLTDISGNVKQAEFSPDGKYIIICTSSLMRGIRYIDYKNAIEVLALDAPNTESIVVSPDESELISGALEKNIFIWDIKGGIKIGELTGHQKWATAVALSRGGKVLISGSDDKTVKLWDLDKRNCIATLEGHKGRVKSVAISANNKFAASTGYDNKIIIWDISDVKLPEETQYEQKEELEKIQETKITAEEKQVLDLAMRSLEFETGKAVILDKSKGSLDEVVKILISKPELKVNIFGHTDNVGNATFNYKLSAERADAVKQYFTQRGIDTSRISAQGFGATRPIADNATEEGRQKNRRVEIIVY
ncbi:MAG: OmpA family protein, partial [Bacteroidales bacterium]|nr:OmpA family protein [Bacteroidales bacterium]